MGHPTSQTVSCDANGTKYVLGPAVFKGTDITSVNAGLDSNSGQWIVNIGAEQRGRRRRSAR